MFVKRKASAFEERMNRLRKAIRTTNICKKTLRPSDIERLVGVEPTPGPGGKRDFGVQAKMVLGLERLQPRYQDELTLFMKNKPAHNAKTRGELLKMLEAADMVSREYGFGAKLRLEITDPLRLKKSAKEGRIVQEEEMK